jgi:hypothetical protein
MQSTQDAWIKEVHRFSNGGQTESRRSFPVVLSISGEKNNRVNTLQTGTACNGTPLFNG